MHFYPFRIFIQTVSLGRYGETYDRWTRKDDEREKSQRADDQSIAMAVDRELTGDEAYQRRLALSKGVRPASPPENNQPGQPQDEDITVPDPAHDSQSPGTGEEAYLRRLAMSTMHRTQPPLQAPSPPSQPRVVTPPPLSFNPFAPPSVPPPPPGDVPGAIPAGDIDAKKKAAAAIAAKLGALAALAPQPPAESDETLPVEEKG